VDIDLVAEMKAGKKTFTEMGATAAYFGRPAAASAEEGEDSYHRLTGIVVAMLAEALETNHEH
jgi:creatinine amidohydrolase